MSINIVQFWKDRQGSVMLEFCLIMPIYLLLFGGTFLVFDLTMAKIHLQEANRNLAWLQDDRYDTKGYINRQLYQNVVEFFEVRNALESTLGDSGIWSFGEEYEKYSKVRNNKNRNRSNAIGNPQFWGHRIEKVEDSGKTMVSLLQDFGGELIGKVTNNNFIRMYSGNMELNMTHISQVYLGAIALSSLLFPGPEDQALYESSYVLTREVMPNQNNRYHNSAQPPKPAQVNREMILLRKMDLDHRNEINNFGILPGGDWGAFQKLLLNLWPVGNLLAK